MHPVTNAPITIVGLRRTDVARYVEEFLVNMACWHLAPALRSAVKCLQSAELTDDAANMMKHVGSRRQETRVMEVVKHFYEHKEAGEVNRILKAMALDEKRFMIGIEETKDADLRAVLMSAIPWSKRSEYRELLSNAGYEGLAATIELPGYSDEPPF
jgi:hypothetical protein